MKAFGYALGILLLVLAAGSAIAQILSLWATSGYRPVSIGSIWYSLHGNSLVGFQALIENNVSPAVWAPIQWLLTVPAWITLAVPGIALFYLCRSRERALRGLN